VGFRDRVRALDVTLFEHVESQTTPDDRRSLLALHAALAETCGTFSCLEIGSFRGGSLQALVADERCTRITSIDPRTRFAPDDRPELPIVDYTTANTTREMLEGLARIPQADVSKIHSIEASTADISPSQVERPDFCFVDGEHTRSAVLRDARFCRAAMTGRGVIAFHDFPIVEPAIVEFLRETPNPKSGYLLRNNVFVVELDPERSLFEDPRIATQLRRPRAVWQAANGSGTLPLLLSADVGRRRLRRRKATQKERGVL
jgi:hypothetical protein